MSKFRVPVLRTVTEYGYYEVEAVDAKEALAKGKELFAASDPSNMGRVSLEGDSEILEDEIVEDWE